MHNSRKDNLRFKIQFSTTNIRWLLGDENPNHELIEWHREEIRKAEVELNDIDADFSSATGGGDETTKLEG